MRLNIRSGVVVFLTLIAIDSQATKRALVYKGPGACSDGCYDAAFQVALQAGFDPVLVSENALNDASTDADVAALFGDAALWIQPGGKSRIAMTSLTNRMKLAVDQFVKSGGGYVGFCAGAFSSTRLVGTTQIGGFNFMPGRTALYRQVQKNAEIIPIEWAGETRHIYWEGGPYLSLPTEENVEVIARYPNGQVAAAKSEYGLGRVFVTGLHPEAPEDWRTYYGLKDPDGSDQFISADMMKWAQRR